MKVLLTGGTGFVGYWLQMTAPVGVEITALNHTTYNDEWDKHDWIFHLAPVGIDRVLEEAKRMKAGVLLASSGGVNFPRDDYLDMKCEDERKLEQSGLDYRIARIWTTCGAHMDWERYAIGRFIRQALNNETITVWGDGSSVRGYLYGLDVGKGLWDTVAPKVDYRLQDVTQLHVMSMMDLARLIARAVGSQAEPIMNIQSWENNDPRQRYCYAKELLRGKYRPKISDEAAILLTIADYRKEHQNA